MYQHNKITSIMYDHLLIYDHYCGPCRTFKQLVDLIDINNKIGYLSLVDANNKGMLDIIPITIRFNSFHLILPNGKILSGEEAVIDLLSILPLGNVISTFIILLPQSKQIIKYIYLILAHFHNKSSCRLKYNKEGSNKNSRS